MAKKRKVDEEQESTDSDQEENDSEPEENDSEPEENDLVDGSDTEEELTKLLEPFNKEQLIDLLRIATSNDPKFLEEIHRVADLDPAHRKLFVHGLGWETTSEKLQEFFSQYGEIEDCNVVADKITGKSKGYGFLLFKHRRSAQKALKEPQKKIESRMTACQLASAGPVTPSNSNNLPNNPIQDTLMRKIYVGNVHSEILADRLHAFFSRYGEIEEGPLGFDKQTGRAKGYALFIYKTVEGARKALEEPSKCFEGHQLYCQKATDNHKLKAAAAASAAPVNQSGSGFDVPSGGGGYNVPGGMGFNAPNGASATTASPAMFGQGLQPYGQGVAPIQAALAVLAAAGQNPAAFGVPPAVMASLNPQPAMASSAMPGYGMGNPSYQNPQVHQVNAPYQSGPTGQGPVPRPHSGVGPMGGYMPR